MKPKPISDDALALFQAHFQQLLDLQHPLVQLAEQIDWAHFEAVFPTVTARRSGHRRRRFV